MARTARTTAAPAAKSTKARPSGPAIEVKIAGGAVKLAAALGLRREPTLDGKTPLVKRSSFTLVADEGGLTFKGLRASNVSKVTRFLRKRATTPAIIARAKIVGDLSGLSDAAMTRAHVTESRRGYAIEAAE